MAGYPMGTHLSFRYLKPDYLKSIDAYGRRKNPIKSIFLLTNYYKNNMHGLDVSRLSAVEQSWLQFVFEIDAKRRSGFSVQDSMTQSQKQLKIIEDRKNELLSTKQEAIVKPDNSQVSDTFGTKTFGKTPTVQSAAPAVQRIGSVRSVVKKGIDYISGKITNNFNIPQMSQEQIQQELSKLNIVELNTKKRIEELQRVIGVFSQLQSSGAVPGDPFTFYHRYLKPYYGNNAGRVAVFYRKYNVEHVNNPRIIRSITAW